MLKRLIELICEPFTPLPMSRTQAWRRIWDEYLEERAAKVSQ